VKKLISATDCKDIKTKAPLVFHAYALLFCLTVIAINPFAVTRGSIWTQPKILCVFAVVILHLLILFKERQPIRHPNQWKLQIFGWLALLASGIISTLLSPFPSRSFFGHSITADGWLYWLLIAGFVLTNSLILKQYPCLFPWQLRGILVGTTLVALSMYPQLLNWKLDYTADSGQLWPGTKHVLATGIYQDHQPVGLYSHRGYASFALAIASVLSLVALKKQWLLAGVALPLTVLHAITLSLARVRGAMLAMLLAWLWLAWTTPRHRPTQQLIITLSLIGLLSFGWTTMERRVINADFYASTPFRVALKHFTSDRIFLWQKAWQGILKRPWFGWGFSGYSIANTYYLCPEGTEPVILEDYFTHCQLETGETLQVSAKAIHAHNIFLDKYISLGVVGASIYLVLMSYYALGVLKAKPEILAFVITYTSYVLTWYDCGQLSHLGWWALSIQTSLRHTS